MGCMNELDRHGACRYCSYTDDLPHLQSYLAPRTILDDRYIVGKMLSYNGEGASYICYDMVRKCKAVVREYMPDTLCERERGTQKIIINPDCLAKYKTYMSEFADMNKVLSRMKNLTHISTPTDIFVENNTTYVILEYVEGVSLRKFLQMNTGYLTWNKVKKLFMPLFTTISIIHNSGIIHRGISPENIIVTTEGELKLTGFSISSIRTSNTGLSPEFYSGYTAPEQYSSLAYQGTWTDVYAVAAVLYRILTGCMPLDANTRLTNDTLVPASRINPGIPTYVSNVISHAMAVRGEDRIQTVNDFVTQLFDKHYQMEHQKGATQTIPIQHPDDSSDRRASKPAKKKSNAAYALVVFIFVAAVVAFSAYVLKELITPADPNASSGRNSFEDSAYDDTEDSEFITEEPIISPDSKEDPNAVVAIMPTLVGERYEQVLKKFGDSFSITAESFYSDDISKGEITEQSIEPGTEYDPRDKLELELKYCKGPKSVPVPDYDGMTFIEYAKLLDSMDIKYKKVTADSDTVTKDYVIKTDIGVGYNINVENGEELTITVSSGKKKKETTKKTETPSDDD